MARSETVTIRLDPKMRYLAELASRVHRRTLSSYIELAIEASLAKVHLSPTGSGTTLNDVADALWDIDEPDRFVNLAASYPNLFTHEEQRLWKLIRADGSLWHGSLIEQNGEEVWNWNPTRIGNLNRDSLRNKWDELRAVAREESAF